MFLCLNYLENEHKDQYIKLAFFLLPFSVMFDFLDGHIARTRYSSPFGKDLDSLADLVSFGISPACMGFTLGLRGFWDSVFMCVFVGCCMLRLARFNIRSNYIADDKGKVPYYEGLPSPCSVSIVVMFFIAYINGRVHSHNVWFGQYYIYPGHFHPLSLVYLVFGILMISTFRIKKF